MKSQIIRNGGGIIEFYKESDGSYYIEDLNSDRPGGGKSAVQEFRRNVGKNKKFTADIIEVETRSRLLEMGLLDEVNKPGGRLEITDQKILSQLKIYRVFKGGGVKIDRLILSYETDASREDMEITFYDGKRVGICLLGKT